MQSAGGNPVHAALEFLNLLEGDGELSRQHILAHAWTLTTPSHPGTDMDVDGMSSVFPHGRGGPDGLVGFRRATESRGTLRQSGEILHG